MVEGDRFAIFNLTSIGHSHIETGTVCQDHSVSTFTEGGVAVAIVSDGHGGAAYIRSDRGSRIAVHTARETIAEFLAMWRLTERDGKKWEEALNRLSRSIVVRWSMAVDADLESDPPGEEELARLPERDRAVWEQGAFDKVKLYGATLIAAVRTDELWFGLQIGDGICVTIDNVGRFAKPIPWDDKCVMNRTTSLCDTGAVNEFRHVVGFDNLPVAIFVATDGVDDTYGEGEDLYKFYGSVFKDFFAETGFETALRRLEAFLPVMSERGSRDDVSIAAIFDRKMATEKTQIRERAEICERIDEEQND
jgi:hypothetical protein